MADLPRTREVIAEELHLGALLTGAQVCVMDAHGREASLAEGEAAVPVEPETLFRVYCAIKPITAVAVAKLVDAGQLSLDEPLAETLPGVRALSETAIKLRDVLTHTAGLHGPTGVQMELLSNARRDELLCRKAVVPKGWRVGRDAAFSEVLGWHILGLVIEKVTGCPLDTYLREGVLLPLGLRDTWIGMSRPEYEKNRDRIGVNYDFRDPPTAMPMLMERGERVCTEVNCAFGGYSTARDLARFYAAVVSHLRDELHASLPAPRLLAEFCSPARERSFDSILRRECTFGLGFMCGLEDFNFGPRWSSSAFGHSAWAGSSFGFADPQSAISVAVITNGILPDEPARSWRPRLLEAIYADCVRERAASAMSSVGAEGLEPPTSAL